MFKFFRLSFYVDKSPIVIVRRGGCSFVQKVRNIEHGGGKLAIVVDEIDDEDATYITMVDDGTGNGIIIPSLLINKTPGETLISYIADVDQTQASTIKISATFSLPKTADVVNFDLIFSTYSDKALDFIADFLEYRIALGSKAKMTPHYISWPCFTCSDEIIQEDCFGNGKYCAIDADDYDIDGRSILLGGIRQKCILKKSIEQNGNEILWWKYMKRAHSMCYNDFSED